MVAAWQSQGVSSDPFRTKLKSQMAFHEIDQAEIARRLHVTPATVSRWISGERMPRGIELAALAQLLEVEPWKLLGSDYKAPLPAAEKPRRGRPPTLPATTVALAVVRRLQEREADTIIDAEPVEASEVKKSD